MYLFMYKKLWNTDLQALSIMQILIVLYKTVETQTSKSLSTLLMPKPMTFTLVSM